MNTLAFLLGWVVGFVRSIPARAHAFGLRRWTWAAALLVRAIVWWCRRTGRWVEYRHAGRPYMTRYVLTGYMTGDPEPPQTLAEAWSISRFRVKWRAASKLGVLGWLRHRLPNLYLHHMHAPDADPSLHNHPWPWAVSLVLLGGYRELRIAGDGDGLDSRLVYAAFLNGTDPNWPTWVDRRWLMAPALNVIRGETYHRIDALENIRRWWQGGKIASGTWTLFLAGPRAGNKGWGYLVEGRGYVDQKTRHAELNAATFKARTKVY